MWPSSDAPSVRSRKDQDSISPSPAPGHGAPTSFFLATEEMLHRRYSDSGKQGTDSTFGVRSLPEAPRVVKQEQEKTQHDRSDAEDDHGRRRSTLRVLPKSRDPSVEEGALQGTTTIIESPPYGFPRLASTLPSVSSLSQDSQGIEPSLPSSPKSLFSRSGRPSDEDSAYDGASQAIASSEDEAEAEQSASILRDAPQLIMPSLQMPSRRPFTERGRSIGKVKILLAGDSGLGKTSLVKSIVQVCEDIVHVDPITSLVSSVDQLSKSTEKRKAANVPNTSTSQLSEIWASTKGYPEWWAELEENKLLRRRKSVDGPVLERNICFVDTPGYGRGLSITEGIQTVVTYIEEQLAKPFTAAASSKGDLIAMLSGNGGTQVDAVLYLIGEELKPADLDFLQRLSQLTNVIPLLAKADTRAPENIDEFKCSISDDLTRLGIRCFPFAADDLPAPPYAVCSAISNDEDNMDASLLMSSNYIQPLLPSELGILITHLLDTDNIARMRYLAAKKLVQSKSALQLLSTATSSQATPVPDPTSSFTTSQTLSALNSSRLQPYRHDRLVEYTRQEEKRAQIRLAKWANDLRRTMRDERAQFEELQQEERSAWLARKMEECDNTSSSAAVSPNHYDEKHMVRSELANVVHHSSSSLFGAATNANDPLGLFYYDEYVRRHGWRIFQVVGAFGVCSAVAVWVARNVSMGCGSGSGGSWISWGDYGCSDWTRGVTGCRPWLY
ncbi:MAG: hypothetical protein Q9220_006862 [cf. Caloplaca sp. 1 TL-2023]